MKIITYLSSHESESGSAMLGVIFMTLISSMLVAGVMQYSTQQLRVTRKALDYQKSQLAAEAALQFGLRELRREAVEQRLLATQNQMQNNLDDRIERLTNVAEDYPDYVFHTEDFEHSLYIDAGPVIRDSTIGEGNYAEWNGNRQEFTITAGSRNPETGAAAAYQLRAQVVSINLITFAIFFEDDLEFLPGPTMEVHGPVHTNSNLYLQTHNRLELYEPVRTAGDFIFQGKDGRNLNGDVLVRNDLGQLISVRNSGSNGDPLDSRNPGWTGEALQSWQHERFLSSAHNVEPLRPPVSPLDPMIELIQRPRSESSQEYQDLTPEEQEQWQMTEDEKFSNRAAVTIHVDENGGVTATDYYGNDIDLQVGADLKESEDNPGEYEKNNDDGHYILENNASVGTSQRFREGREDCDVAPVDIYMDNLLEQVSGHLDVASSSPEDNRSGLIYITRDEPSDGSMPAVRLRNASEIDREDGISIASDKPVYVEGHFNRDNTKPVLVAGDAVAMLSCNWQDHNSFSGLNNRIAKDTEHHLVVMTGSSETVGNDYGGGVENIYRYLEEWSGKTHFFRGSLICLWPSQIADGEWSYGSYYKAPSRDWGYDDLYTTTSPPGMIRVFGLEELEWSQIPYAEAEEEFQVSLPGDGPPDEHPGQEQGPDGEGPPGAEHWPLNGDTDYPFTD